MRLFVAFLFDEPVLVWLGRLQTGLEKKCSGVRWISRNQLHMTLKFLGEVPDQEVHHVAEAMQQGAAHAQPFTMDLSGCGCFPPRGPVRIVWVGASDPSGTMLRAVEAINGAVENAGYPPENRPWSPHITIGRARDDRSGGAIRAAVESFDGGNVRQSVDSVVLMSSVLSPKGATYTPVHTAKLG
jgi:RNA 2',3'-cyclic 3'-phosphodiesterase